MAPKKEINTQIGERIKQARRKVKCTQEKLAEEINVSVQYISDLERGKVGASVSTLIKICGALNTSSDFLLFGSRKECETAAIENMLSPLNERQLKIVEDSIKITLKALNEK